MLQAPTMVERASDPGVQDGQLSPLELAVREVRQEIVRDLGGDVTTVTRLVLDAALEAWLIKQHLAKDVVAMALAGALVDRRSRRARPIVQDWLKVQAAFLQVLRDLGGTEPPEPKEPTLDEIVQDIVTRRPQEQTMAESAPMALPDGVVVEPGGFCRGQGAGIRLPEARIRQFKEDGQ
jgi:hypothetical protein